MTSIPWLEITNRRRPTSRTERGNRKYELDPMVLPEATEFIALWNALTLSEKVVLRCRCTGMVSGECAEYLDMSPQTLKNHVTNAFKALGIDRMTQIAYYLGRYDGKLEG